MTAKEDERGARERILSAAILVVARDGSEALRVRVIAEEAGVNVAAINYYFGNKERLVEEVLERTRKLGLMEQLAELDALVLAEGGDIRGALNRFIPDFLRDAVRYPRLVAAHLHEAITKQDYSGPTVQGCRDFLEGFYIRVRDVLPPGTEEERRVRVAVFWSSIYFTLLVPQMWDGFVARSFHDVQGTDSLARGLVRQLVGEFPAQSPRGLRASG